jgi:hypothetical protein
MPSLTRRRSPDAEQETWLVYYGDIQVGIIKPSSPTLAINLPSSGVSA